MFTVQEKSCSSDGARKTGPRETGSLSREEYFARVEQRVLAGPFAELWRDLKSGNAAKLRKAS